MFVFNCKISGRVHELLINSEKASTSPVFEENVERFLCLRFSITHTHDQISKSDGNYGNSVSEDCVGSDPPQ